MYCMAVLLLSAVEASAFVHGDLIGDMVITNDAVDVLQGLHGAQQAGWRPGG
jgi:hypothetical protein